jgi:uncharacterized protein with von Willebrand factor type A (vWA) domain
MARAPVAFARALRRDGLDVPVDSVIHYARALDAVGVGRREPVYWAGRATLVRQPEDVAAYDRAFDTFWRGKVEWPGHPGLRSAVPPMARPPQHGGDDRGARDAADEPDAEGDEQIRVLRYSATEQLRHKDFAACTTDELAEAYRLMRGVRVEAAPRRTRRLRRRPGHRGEHDTRATVRLALRNGGEVVRLVRRQHLVRPRRVVLLCDVSGSMEPYARALLRFLHVAVAGSGRVEAFALGTRLTRVTRQLSTRDPDRAMAAATDRVADWSGGTRLGEGIRAFNERYGVRGMARDAVVVILSDGWDRGDPALLAGEMARLRRVAHRVVWVNPLKATAGYEPLARGMAAALPHVDRFVEGHSMASLEALVEVIAR